MTGWLPGVRRIRGMWSSSFTRRQTRRLLPLRAGFWRRMGAFRRFGKHILAVRWLATAAPTRSGSCSCGAGAVHREDPLDRAAILANPMELLIVATEAWSGKPRYFSKEALHPNDYSAGFACAGCRGIVPTVRLWIVDMLDAKEPYTAEH